MINKREIDVPGDYPVIVKKFILGPTYPGGKAPLEYPRAVLQGIDRFDVSVDLEKAANEFPEAQLSHLQMFNTKHEYVRGIITRDDVEYYFTAKVDAQNFDQDDMEELISYAILTVDKMVRTEKKDNANS